MYRLIFIVLFLCTNSVTGETQNYPRVCIIGAGVSGLSVSYYLQEAGITNFDVYEASDNVGGTWRYDSRVGEDEYGYPIHSSMYKNLRTNLPRQTIEFPSFPMPPDTPTFPSGPCFYKYIQEFTDHFGLRKYIKFSNRVTSVSRINDQWRVQYIQLPQKEIKENVYDYILVCNGHNHQPNWPDNIEEIRRNFSGLITHSHDYRQPQAFQHERVVIVGAGPSAWDIGLEVATLATKLIHSHHSKGAFQTPFPDNYVRKPDINTVDNFTITFVDGTVEEVDVILYCTGYHYYYPFLDESSNLDLALQYVAPLHRNTVNINQPTMSFLGLGVHAVVTTAIHVQARYITSLIMGNFSLPLKELMMHEWQKQAANLQHDGKPLKYLHSLAPKEVQYFDGLTKEAKIDDVPPVLLQMGKKTTQDKMNNWYTFRLFHYEIINNNMFTLQYKPDDKLCYFNNTYIMEQTLTILQ